MHSTKVAKHMIVLCVGGKTYGSVYSRRLVYLMSSGRTYVHTYSRNEELGNSGKCMGETHLLCLNWSRSIQNCVVASCTAVSFCPLLCVV